MNIYLSGTVTAWKYREFFLNRLKHIDTIKLIDPIKTSDSLLEQEMKKEGITQRDIDNYVSGLISNLSSSDRVKKAIVEKDKREIDSCQLMICFMERFTVGTLMEIMYAHMKKIPVLLINPGYTFKDDVWLYYHAFKVFDNMEDCAKYIENGQ